MGKIPLHLCARPREASLMVGQKLPKLLTRVRFPRLASIPCGIFARHALLSLERSVSGEDADIPFEEGLLPLRELVRRHGKQEDGFVLQHEFVHVLHEEDRASESILCD